MSQTVDTAPLYGLSAKNQRIILTVQAHTSNYHYNKCYRPSYCICDQGYFPHRLRMGLSYSKAGAPMYEHTFSGFRLLYLCDGVGRPSPRAGRRAGPPRVPSRQAGTAAEEANEKVRLESRKGPRSAESTRISTPLTIRFWICYKYLLQAGLRGSGLTPTCGSANTRNGRERCGIGKSRGRTKTNVLLRGVLEYFRLQ